MSLVKWNPESFAFPSFTSWLEDWFDDNGNFPKPAVKGVSMPAVNITENDKEFKLEVAAPGFKKEDFKIEVKNGYLVISGETKMEEKKEDEKYARREFRFNSFTRSFALPENIKEETINARYNDGILFITLPKTETAKKEPQKLIKVQ